MQTFLPFASFARSAAALDSRRLGKQIGECRQILAALQAGPGAPWYGHPAVQMWNGAEALLADYAYECCREWRRRFGTRRREWVEIVTATHDGPVTTPWLTHPPTRAGHRGHLYRKDPVHYAAFESDATAPLLYPVRVNDTWLYVERVAPGRFRLGDGPVCRSVRAAVGVRT